MTICIVPSWTHCRLSKPKGSSCEGWSLVGSSTWRSQRYFWPGELQLSLASDSLGPFFYLSWWFLGAWPLEARMFEYLVSNWWNCWQKIGRILPYWRRYTAGSGLWGFKRLLLISVCIPSLFLSLSVVDQDLSTQLYRHCTNMNSNPLKP